MAYCMIEDLYLRLSPKIIISKVMESGETEAEYNPKIQLAINDASGEIDGYLRGIYTLPLNPVVDEIKKYCADIAIYNLFAKKGITDTEKIITDRYNQAISYLKMINKGNIVLYIPESPDSSGGGVDFICDTPKYFL